MEDQSSAATSDGQQRIDKRSASDDDDLPTFVKIFLGKTDNDDAAKSMKKAIQNADLWFILVTGGITTLIYTLFTFVRACYSFGNALVMQESGFYYMILVTGLMWVNLTATLAIVIFHRRNKPSLLTFRNGLLSFILLKVVTLIVILIILTVALWDPSVEPNVSLKPLQFGLPLIIYCLTYGIFICLQVVAVYKGETKESV